jgi:hypothetical protein
MFGSVIDKIGGLLSRSFILASFFPFLIFVAASLAMAWIALPQTRPTLTAFFELEAGKQAVVIATVMIAIAVVAYVVSPLTVVVRQMLEGRLFLPRWAQNKMLAGEQQTANDLKSQRDEANNRDNVASDFSKNKMDELFAARREGNKLKTLGTDVRIQIKAADKQLNETEKLATPGHGADDATMDALQQAADLTVIALRNNSIQLPDTASRADRILATTLQALQMRTMGLLQRAVDDARQGLIDTQETLYGRFPMKGIGPTRIANIRSAAESHGLDAYGIEFDFLWPRLRLAILKEDEKVAEIIDNAKTQVDFSLLMVLLCALFTIGWVIALALLGGSPLTVILLGVAGQWIIFFFLRVVEESIKQLGELAGAAIDFYRFKLLRRLDVNLPGDLVAERALWQRLQQSTTALGTIDISYSHSPP